MKTTKPISLPIFNEKQIDKQLKGISKFLQSIYPFLKEDAWNKCAIELRPLKRDVNARYIRSYNTWRLQQKDKDELRKFLQRINGQGYCVYYSTFAFQYHKEVKTIDGKIMQKGKVNNQNAVFTCILPMDFDDITPDEFLKEKEKLQRLGIETIDIFTGHGFQSIILLEKGVYDTKILKKFTKLLIQKGFKVDSTISDAARVMRLPFTFNSKALDKKNKYYQEGSREVIPVCISNWTENRYDVVEVFNKLHTMLDVVDNQIDILELQTVERIEQKPLLNSERKQEEIEKKELAYYREQAKLNKLVEKGTSLYPAVSFARLPLAIQKMLMGTKEGIRNATLMFLIPFFKNTLGLSLERIINILTVWGEMCNPIIDEATIKSEVKRLYRYNSEAKYGKYTPEMVEVYGYLDFDNFSKKGKVILPNMLFTEYANLPDNSIRIYLAMHIAKEKHGLSNFNLSKLLQIIDVSTSTLQKNLKPLLQNQLVVKKRRNRREGNSYEYYVNPYFNTADGFTMIPIDIADWLLKKLSGSELKLYIYLVRATGNLGGECWESQKELAKHLGKKSQTSMSKLTQRLHDKGVIYKETKCVRNVPHTIYRLIDLKEKAS